MGTARGFDSNSSFSIITVANKKSAWFGVLLIVYTDSESCGSKFGEFRWKDQCLTIIFISAPWYTAQKYCKERQSELVDIAKIYKDEVPFKEAIKKTIEDMTNNQLSPLDIEKVWIGARNHKFYSRQYKLYYICSFFLLIYY